MDIRILLKSHVDQVENYLLFWNGSASGMGEEMAKTEAAYYLLANIGMVYRYTNDQQILDIFHGYPVEDRKSLVEKSCEYILECNWISQIKDLFIEEDLDTDAMEQLEILLTQRDALDVNLGTSRALSHAIPEEEYHLRPLLVRAITKAYEFDEELWKRPDVLMEAVTILHPIRDLVRIPIDLKKQWWFQEPQFFADKIERDFENTLLRFADLNTTRKDHILSEALRSYTNLEQQIQQICLLIIGARFLNAFKWTAQREMAGLRAAAAGQDDQPEYILDCLEQHPGVGVYIGPAYEINGMRYQFNFSRTPSVDTNFIGADVVLYCGTEETGRGIITDRGEALVPLAGKAEVSCVVIEKDGQQIDRFVRKDA